MVRRDIAIPKPYLIEIEVIPAKDQLIHYKAHLEHFAELFKRYLDHAGLAEHKIDTSVVLAHLQHLQFCATVPPYSQRGDNKSPRWEYDPKVNLDGEFIYRGRRTQAQEKVIELIETHQKAGEKILLFTQRPDYCNRMRSWLVERQIESEAEMYRTFQVPGAGGIERIDHDRIRPESGGGFECAWTLCGTLDLCENVVRMLTAVHQALRGYSYGSEPRAPTVGRISDDVVAYLTRLEGVKFIPDSPSAETGSHRAGTIICESGEPMILLQQETLIESLEQAAGLQPPWSQRDEYKAWEQRRKAALYRFLERVSGQNQSHTIV